MRPNPVDLLEYAYVLTALVRVGVRSPVAIDSQRRRAHDHKAANRADYPEIASPTSTSNDGVSPLRQSLCGDNEIADAPAHAGLEVAYACALGLDADARAEYLGRFGIEPFGGITHESIMSAPDFHVLVLGLGPDALTVP